MTNISAARLASTLVKKIFSVYLALAVGLTLFQVGLDYHATYSQVLAELDSASRAFEPGVSDALWDYQDELIKSIARGIVDGNVIVGVDISDISERVRISVSKNGAKLNESGVAKRIELFHTGGCASRLVS